MLNRWDAKFRKGPVFPHRTTPMRAPHCNLIECTNRTLKSMVSQFVGKNHRRWDEYLLSLQFASNAARRHRVYAGVFKSQTRACLLASRPPARWEHHTTYHPPLSGESIWNSPSASGTSVPETKNTLQSPEKKLETARRREGLEARVSAVKQSRRVQCEVRSSVYRPARSPPHRFSQWSWIYETPGNDRIGTSMCRT